MPKKFNKKGFQNGMRKKHTGGGGFKRKSFSSGGTQYHGPVHQRQKDDTITVNLVEGYSQSVVASSGTWTNNSVFPTSHVTAIGDFTSWAGLYQEFRVVGMSVVWIPALQNSTPANSAIVTATPMFLCPSEQENTALTGDVAAWQHEGKRCGSLTQKVKCTIRAKEINSMVWNLITAGVTNAMCIKSYISGTSSTSTPTIALGHFYVEYAVQFRYRVLTDTSLATKSVAISEPILAKKDEKSQSDQENKNVVYLEQKEKKDEKGKEVKLPGTLTIVEDYESYQDWLLMKKEKEAALKCSTSVETTPVVKQLAKSYAEAVKK